MERDIRGRLSEHSIRQRLIALLCLAAAFAFSACERVTGHGDYVIRGSLVNAETGAPVAHHGLKLVASHEASDPKLSIEHQGLNHFEVRASTPMVRLRVGDSTDRYELHEEQLVVPKEGLDHVVRLVPTHYVLLKARVVVQEDGAWIPLPPPKRTGGWSDLPPLGDTPFVVFDLNLESPDGWRSDYCSGSSFELRVPRDRLRMVAINSARQPDPPILDLTGVTGDVVEREIRLVKNR